MPRVRRKCKVKGCATAAYVRGLCKKHGAQGLCNVEGCKTAESARGLCYKHGARGFCTIEGCGTAAYTRRLCKKHGANDTRAAQKRKRQQPQPKTSRRRTLRAPAKATRPTSAFSSSPSYSPSSSDEESDSDDSSLLSELSDEFSITSVDGIEVHASRTTLSKLADRADPPRSPLHTLAELANSAPQPKLMTEEEVMEFLSQKEPSKPFITSIFG